MLLPTGKAMKSTESQLGFFPLFTLIFTKEKRNSYELAHLETVNGHNDHNIHETLSTNASLSSSL
jgi:hypothetical protein